MSHDKKVVSGLLGQGDLNRIREAVCAQVEKVYDSCKEKDCIENEPIVFKNEAFAQWVINNSINVKCSDAEVVDVFADVEPLPFKRGFYTVDVKFFIRVDLDFFIPSPSGGTKIKPLRGILTFDKKVVLFGSEGNVKIFKSRFTENDIGPTEESAKEQDNLPIAKIEVADPICLNAQIQDIRDKLFEKCCCKVPKSIMERLEDYDEDFDENQVLEARGGSNAAVADRRVVATVGLFSIIKLVRKVQVLLPAFNFCVPDKECIASTDENPCDLFDAIDFPVEEFFPPQIFDFPGALEAEEDFKDKC
ncbi:MAG: hypothetical protein ACOX7R_07330 [Acetivibrionales bacterium]|jgi:hypothetical protein